MHDEEKTGTRWSSGADQKVDKGDLSDHKGDGTGEYGKEEPQCNSGECAGRRIDSLDSCKQNGMQDKNTHG